MKLIPEKMDDISLIEEVRHSGNNSCFQEIVNRHSGIYLQMVHNYAPKYHSIDNTADLIDSKEYHIFAAIKNFDETRNIKFSTYLGNHTKWLCLNSANKRVHDSIDENYDCVFESEEKEESDGQKTLNEVFSEIQTFEDKRVEKIFQMRYLNGKNKLTPWRKIAKELDLSIQGCINIHNSAFKKLKKNLIKNYD